MAESQLVGLGKRGVPAVSGIRKNEGDGRLRDLAHFCHSGAFEAVPAEPAVDAVMGVKERIRYFVRVFFMERRDFGWTGESASGGGISCSGMNLPICIRNG